jgi:nitrilase
MASFATIRVAAIQATPVILDGEASVQRAVELIGKAAQEGAQLAVLPETFVPLYPSNVWARKSASFVGSDELWERLWRNSVDVPGPLVDELVEACREHDIHVAVGVNERESERPGSLYNTLLLLGPEGVALKHRKLVPTHHERLFHGFGPGGDLGVADTPLGRVGGLICWENRMPLARWAVYRQGPQIWLAPTADDSGGWLATVRHIAIESGAFVVSCRSTFHARRSRMTFPSSFPTARSSAAAERRSSSQPGAK